MSEIIIQYNPTHIYEFNFLTKKGIDLEHELKTQANEESKKHIEIEKKKNDQKMADYKIMIAKYKHSLRAAPTWRWWKVKDIKQRISLYEEQKSMANRESRKLQSNILVSRYRKIVWDYIITNNMKVKEAGKAITFTT